MSDSGAEDEAAIQVLLPPLGYGGLDTSRGGAWA
jgi:hypothetical protein